MIWQRSWIHESRGLCYAAVSSAKVASSEGFSCWSIGWLREESLYCYERIFLL